MNKRIAIVGTIIAGFFALIFRNWLSATPLSSGDWSFRFPEEIKQFVLFPSSWNMAFGGGLGGNGVFLAGLETYFLTTARLFYQLTGLPWSVSERIFWYIPFLLVGTCSSVFLVRTMLPGLALWYLTPVIFLTNSYIVLVTGGGQMGIAMAYAIAPLVFARFITLFENPTVSRGIITGFLLSLMVLFDPRIAYVLMIGVLVWGLISRPKPTFVFTLPFLCVVLVHAFWILPLVVFRVNPMDSMGSAYNSIAAVRFFSFADFSHTLALLHPNWPENLFGKAYFLQPEFLIIPIVAFSALLNKKISRPIVSLAGLGLLGIFLAKGANDPGGGIYLWLFSHVPGFNVFRDPTKFYLLIALSYSILIPAAIEQFGKKKIVSIIFILFWLFTIRQAVVGQLGGTFVPHALPYEYERLKDIINQPEYFRTLWVPRWERYGFSSYMHPAIDAATVLDTSSTSAMLSWLDSEKGMQQLKRWSVKYVVLPYDSQGEIFLDDRMYSESKRDVFQKALDENLNLRKITQGISPKISVYEVAGYKDHLWLDRLNESLVWHMTVPTLYEISISDLDRPTELIFSESYDPYWQLTVGGMVYPSKKTGDSLNSFSLPPMGTVSGTLEYLPQRYVWVGLGISIVTFCCATIIIWNQKKYR